LVPARPGYKFPGTQSPIVTWSGGSVVRIPLARVIFNCQMGGPGGKENRKRGSGEAKKSGRKDRMMNDEGKAMKSEDFFSRF